MRIIKALPPDSATLLLDLGPRILVLVEGEDDFNAFEEWYQEKLGEIMFYVPGGGSSGVVNLLSEVLSISTKGRAFGIIDRDFRNAGEIDLLKASHPHLFVLRRYAIENYLLEPAALHEVMRVYYKGTHQPPTLEAIEQNLCRLCQQLQTLMAANWVFSEQPGTEFFSAGHAINSRTELVQQAAIRLGCHVDEADLRIAAKETAFAPLLNNLGSAHECVNGKHLLHHFYEKFVIAAKRGFRKDHFESLLVQETKRIGVHQDIKTIMEDGILLYS